MLTNADEAKKVAGLIPLGSVVIALTLVQSVAQIALHALLCEQQS
jgi:hypothetical protein